MGTERRHSRKREAIRQLLAQTREHPSAETIYARLKPEYPDLSLGTVYRNLALFLEEGEAVRVATVAGQDRYDGCTRPHAHFVCRRCGQVIDVETPLPDPAAFGRDMPGRVRDYSLTFYGVCDHCDHGQ